MNMVKYHWAVTQEPLKKFALHLHVQACFQKFLLGYCGIKPGKLNFHSVPSGPVAWPSWEIPRLSIGSPTVGHDSQGWVGCIIILAILKAIFLKSKKYLLSSSYLIFIKSIELLWLITRIFKSYSIHNNYFSFFSQWTSTTENTDFIMCIFGNLP